MFTLFLGWFPKETRVCALVPLLPKLLLSLWLISAPFRREGRKLSSHTFHRKGERLINDPKERCGGEAHPLLDTQEATAERDVLNASFMENCFKWNLHLSRHKCIQASP